jgi:2-polyprenyl-6-methoxyphenol hydroxylase-like FAD-dependent oxidoreductase
VLPHKAGGALSAIEDAEALSAFLLNTAPDAVHAALQQVFRVRYKRASEIQAESRADGIDAPPRPQSEAQFVRMWSYGGAWKWMEERPEMVLET